MKTDQFCINCGSHVSASAKFCPNCGKSLITNQNQNNQKSLTKGLIALIIGVCLFFLMSASVVVGIAAFKYMKSLDKSKNTEAPVTEYEEYSSDESFTPEDETVASNLEEHVDENNNEEASEPEVLPEQTDEAELSDEPETKESTYVEEIAPDYILPDSDIRLYSEEELDLLSKGDLRIARNEIYARYGRKFKDPQLQAYFDNKSWYYPIYEPDEFDKMGDNLLTETELANTDNIKKVEEGKTKEVWGNTDVTEYYDPDLGVHFYLPSEVTATLSVPEYWGDAGSIISVNGMGMKNESIMATTYVSREVSIVGDAAPADYHTINYPQDENRIYEIAFLYDYDDELSDAAIAFKDKYAEKIAASAYVDPYVVPHYYSFSIADSNCPESEEGYWEIGKAPSWIEKNHDGIKTVTVGNKMAPGEYYVHCTFGSGTLTITDETGYEKYVFKDNMNTFTNAGDIPSDTVITLEKGDVLKLDADDSNSYAMTFTVREKY